jgi:hypothetical protein
MILRVSEHATRMTGGVVMSLVAGVALSLACAQPTEPSAVSPLGGASTEARAPAATPNFTPADLIARGWTCLTPPTPNRIVCSHPKQGFPVFGNPPPEDRPSSYSLWMFDGAGNFLGPYTLLRTDLYQGQPCDGTGAPWILRAAVGYYECVHGIGG